MKRHTSRSKKNSRSNENDYLVRIISVQITISVLVFLTAFAFSKFGGDSFQDIVNEYKRLTAEDLGIEEIKDALSNKDETTQKESENEPQADALSPLDEDEGTKADEQASLSDSRHMISDATLSPLAYSDLDAKSTSWILQSLIKEKPVLPLENSKITSGFGSRRHPITRKQQFHKGTDFMAEVGDRVRAVLDGEVKEAGFSNSRGYYIILQHKSKIESYYYHNSKLLVKKGTVVRAGESIALAGSTGDSTGPHVHLEVHVNGEPKDPMKILFKGYEI